MVDIEILSKLIPFWDALNEQERRELAHYSCYQSFGVGSCIHDAQQACIGVFFVTRGFARVYMLSEEGREITLFRIEEGESCVLSAACVMPLITFDILVDAGANMQLVVVPSDYFSKLMARNAMVESYTYKQTTKRFSEVMWVMQQQLFFGLDKRLALFLLNEIERTGNECIEVTHDEIARHIGSAREAVSRMLKTFAEEGLIQPFRGGLKILNKQALRAR